MLRRFAPKVAPLRSSAIAARRSFFYAGAGESGIWAATGFRMLQVLWVFVIAGSWMTYRIVFCRYSTKRQFVGDSTDLWEDDGTEMEGDEATANIRIQHERIMPFMTAIEERIAGGGAPSHDDDGHHGAHH